MRSTAYSLPNLLTYARIVCVPLVVLCFFVEGSLRSPDYARWTSLVIFIIASITDYFDGYLARAWKQTSTIGRMLDPIADKLLVCALLLMLVHTETIKGWAIWAAIVILCREILVSGLREFLADLKVSVPVSKVAKWKTTAQLLALGFLVAGPAGDTVLPYNTQIGIVMLWIAAALTIYTGWDYFNAGIRHMVDEDLRGS